MIAEAYWARLSKMTAPEEASSLGLFNRAGPSEKKSSKAKCRS